MGPKNSQSIYTLQWVFSLSECRVQTLCACSNVYTSHVQVTLQHCNGVHAYTCMFLFSCLSICPFTKSFYLTLLFHTSPNRIYRNCRKWVRRLKINAKCVTTRTAPKTQYSESIDSIKRSESFDFYWVKWLSMGESEDSVNEKNVSLHGQNEYSPKWVIRLSMAGWVRRLSKRKKRVTTRTKWILT